MDDDAVEVSPLPPEPKICRQCGGERPPGGMYCASCKAARQSAQWRDQKRRHRARKRLADQNRAEEQAVAAALEAMEDRSRAEEEARQRRRAYIDGHGW